MGKRLSVIDYFQNEERICRYFQISPAEFKLSLTHASYNAEKNNSRFVFVGMFSFKGYIADWVFKHIGGTGTQLQHYYGNITSNAYLENLFDKLGFNNYIYYGNTCKPETQKHIFMFGFIGCIFSLAPPECFEGFVEELFIFPNDHLMPKVHHAKDDWQKLVFLYRQNNKGKPEINYFKLADNKHRFEIKSQYTEMVSHESVSYRYAKKKAIKMALTILADELEEKLISTKSHITIQESISDKKSAKKLEDSTRRIEDWKIEKARKRIEKEAAKQLKTKLAIATDEKRRKAKLAAKSKTKKTKDTLYRDYSSEEIAAMNPAKRRRLEDLGILPKK